MSPRDPNERTPDDSRRYPTVDYRLGKVERRCAEFEARAEAKFQALEEALRSLRDGSSDGEAVMVDLKVAQGKLEALPARMDRLEEKVASLDARLASFQGRIWGAVGLACVILPVATAFLTKLMK